MKRRLTLVCFFMICVSLLSACSLPQKIDTSTPPESAAQAQTYMDATMAEQQSYRADVTMNFVLYSGQTKMKGELTSIVIEDVGQGLGNYYSYTEVRNAMYVGNSISPRAKVTSIDAYCDGYAYQSYSYNGQRRKLRSKMRASEFAKYREGDSDIIDFTYTDCQNTTLTQTDEGYTILCSGYSAENLHAMAVAAGIAELIDDALQDMQVTILLGRDYLPVEISLELVFDSERYYKDTRPYFRMLIEFSDYNQAEHILRTIEPEDYTEIEDLQLLKELEQKIAETVNVKKGSFVRETAQNVTFGKETTNTSQVDVSATFSNTKEGFSFKAHMADNDIGRTVTYANGDMIGLDAPNGSKINRMTDEQAKAEMLAWINDPSIGFTYTRVLNIEKTKTGYLVTMIPAENGIVTQLSDAMNISLQQEYETIEFVFKWGKLVKLIHSFGASTTISGQDFAYEGSITVTFE